MNKRVPAAWLAVLLASGCGGGPSTDARATKASSAPQAKSPSVGDPLPSWSEGSAKKAIVDFVGRVTREGGPDFVPAPERIAIFDNDGTLWSEQPMYVQVAFALDRVKALAPQHPEWKQKQPFKGILEGDMKAALASGEKGILEMMAVTHVGNTIDEFAQIVTDWIGTARHPKTQRLYTEMVYQPMLEVLAGTALRAHRASHGCGARMGLRSRVPRWQARAGIGRSAEARLDPRGHEAGLEDHLPLPTAVTMA